MTTRRGFILATTLLVMTLLTVMLVAAFVLISAEFRTTNGSYSTSRSLNLAQAGLQTYFANPHGLSSGYDSTNFQFPGGYARVVAQQLRAATGSTRAVWIVYSTGVDTTRSIIINGTGVRIVARLAQLNNGTLPARAALVSINDTHMTGNSNSSAVMDGRDAGFGACTQPGGSLADTTGLTVRSTGYGVGSGSPVAKIEYLDSAKSVGDSTHIDWLSLVSGSFTPDDVNTFPPATPTSDTSHTHYFTGDATLPTGTRKGILVVSGNLTISSSAHWDGIILVGGTIDTPSGPNPTYTIHGILITGLNILLGQNVGANSINRGNGNNNSAVIRWDWCYTRNSMAALSYLSPTRGTYLDSWKTY